MNAEYLCPYCTSHLNVDDKLILVAKNKEKARGLVLLSTELGNYDVKKHPDFEIPDGEKVDLSCPVCHHDLVHDSNENLVKIIRVENGKEETLLFSQIVGEQCTYRLVDSKVTTYGEHALRYTDPEWYLQDHQE